MRPLATLVLFLSLAAIASACPWVRRPCHPRPVVYVQSCYPPPVYYHPCPPVQVIRVVPAPAPAPAKPAAAKEDVAPEGWCHIRGRVVFDGNPIPKQTEIPNGKGAYTEDWVVDPDTRGVKNVIVWLAPEPSPDQWAALKATAKTRSRDFPPFRANEVYPGLPKGVDREALIPEGPIAFIPRVLAVQAGSDVAFTNRSTRPENVKWDSRDNGQANRLVPAGGQVRMGPARPERLPIQIESSIHPWMRAYVKVFDHPYFAVTAPDGSFEIKFAPKGNLRLFVWQETAGYRNGAEGRFGEPIRVPSGRLDLSDLKIKEPPRPRP